MQKISNIFSRGSIFLLITFLIIACVEQEEAPLNLDSSVAVEIMDDAYGNHPRQKIDVYLPANRSTDKTKLFI